MHTGPSEHRYSSGLCVIIMFVLLLLGNDHFATFGSLHDC